MLIEYYKQLINPKESLNSETNKTTKAWKIYQKNKNIYNIFNKIHHLVLKIDKKFDDSVNLLYMEWLGEQSNDYKKNKGKYNVDQDTGIATLIWIIIGMLSESNWYLYISIFA